MKGKVKYSLPSSVFCWRGGSGRGGFLKPLLSLTLSSHQKRGRRGIHLSIAAIP